MKNKLSLAAAGIALAAITAFTAPAHANLVTNGGFETGDFSGWSDTGDATFNGVQCPGADDSVYAGNCSAYFGPFISEGGIAQSINVGSAGLTWNLSFAFLSDGAAPSSFSVLFGGETLLSLTNPSAGDYTLYQFSGTTTSDNMTLAFNFYDEVSYLFLDDVSVTTASAVPEPATTGLLAAGLASLLFMRRRKKD
jgi:hypothetical protein